MTTIADVSRVFSGIAKRLRVTDDGCWEWTGCCNDRGYGQIRIAGDIQYVHRLVYMVTKGVIPDGMVLDHIVCSNPPCCNPDHVKICTQGENALRSDSPPSVNARKKHCPKGHEYTPENTRIHMGGWRMCRACGLERVQRIKADPVLQEELKQKQRQWNLNRRSKPGYAEKESARKRLKRMEKSTKHAKESAG